MSNEKSNEAELLLMEEDIEIGQIEIKNFFEKIYTDITDYHLILQIKDLENALIDALEQNKVFSILKLQNLELNNNIFNINHENMVIQK